MRTVEAFTAGENFQLHPLLYTPIPRLPDSLHQLTHGKRPHARFGVRRGDDAPYAVFPRLCEHLLRLFPCLRAVIQPINQMMMDIDKPVRWTFFQSLSFFFP